MTLTIHMGTKGLIGFPSQACQVWSIEIRAGEYRKAFGFMRVNQSTRGSFVPAWKWQIAK